MLLTTEGTVLNDQQECRAAASRRARGGQGQIRAGHQGRSLGVCHRRHGAGFQERHRTGRAVGARPPRRPAQARKGGPSHLAEHRRGVARGRHRPHQPRTHRPILRDGQGRAGLSAGAARVPGGPGRAIDLDHAARLAAAGRRHEHPGARHRAGPRIRSHPSQAPASRRPADRGLFAGADRRRLHLRSRRHSERERRRAASQRRCRGGIAGRRSAMGRPADQAGDRVHHHAAAGTVARAGRRHHRRHHPCPSRKRGRRCRSFPASSTG